MTDSRFSRRVPRWVTFADGLTVALLALACYLGAGGRLRGQLGPIFVSITSARRVAAWALVVTAIRHGVCRRPTLPARLVILAAPLNSTWRWLRRWLDDRLPPLARDQWGAPEKTKGAGIGETAFVAVLMVALTAIMTYPQIRDFTAVADLGDPVFSVWRLAWVAHQLVRDPLHLYDANILYPARSALAYSDSLLLPNFTAAPFVWLGAQPVVVHTVLLLASFVLAGVCMYLFARSLTPERPAALVAAIAFAFYPYRFDQYCHFEQLFSFWMPLALWALRRTIARQRPVDGLLFGAAVAAQYLSGMYLGAFFILWLVPVWAGLAMGARGVRASLKPLAAGAALAAVLVAPTLPPHFRVREDVGERRVAEISGYSAQPGRYLVPNSNRLVYRDNLARRRHELEKDLFPGIVVVALALVALVPPLSAPRIAYTLGLVFAFEASLGTNGYVYPLLYRLLVPIRAFRVPARFSMLVGLSLAVLAGYGVSRITARITRPIPKYLFGAVICLAVLVDFSSAVPLQPIWRERPAVYRWFDGRPTSAIADLPVPAAGTPLDSPECAYMYFSTVHWQRLANGYTGAWPASYYWFRDAMLTFPSDDSIRLLRDRAIDYVVLHEGFYGHLVYRRVLAAAVQRVELREVFRVSNGHTEDRIYQVLRESR